jgi:uncharacterized protein (TIGR02246 family)
MSPIPLMCISLLTANPKAGVAQDNVAAVNEVLDDWHRAAARADEERYFSHFTPDAIFLGTDASERWTRDAFRAWARPHFARGKAWSFTSVERHVFISPDERVAWFDEALSTTKMGPCRGSGVLLRQGGTWRIAQYNLSIPLPNALVDEVKSRIEELEKKGPADAGVPGRK